MQATTSYAVSEIRVVYQRQPMKDRPQITSSADAVPILLQGFCSQTIGLQEEFLVLYLNRAHKVLGLYRAGIGGITGTVADVRLILAVALKIGAVSIICAHNHPSGNLQPSRADQEITEKIRSAAKVHDMKLLDHLILDPEGSYYSFADEGFL